MQSLDEKSKITEELVSLYKLYEDLNEGSILKNKIETNNTITYETNCFRFPYKINLDLNKNQNFYEILKEKLCTLDDEDELAHTCKKPNLGLEIDQNKYDFYKNYQKERNTNYITEDYMLAHSDKRIAYKYRHEQGNIIGFSVLAFFCLFASITSIIDLKYSKLVLILLIISLVGTIIFGCIAIKLIKDNIEINKILKDNEQKITSYKTNLKTYKLELIKEYDVKMLEETKLIEKNINSIIAAKENQIIKIENEITNIKRNIEKIIKEGIIPISYASNYNIVVHMLNIMFNKRADNMKELANVYEDDKFKQFVLTEMQAQNNKIINSMNSYNNLNSYYTDLLVNHLEEFKELNTFTKLSPSKEELSKCHSRFYDKINN